MGKVASRVRESGLIVGGLGVLGFIGLVWLMIYGNLSGNLGFQDTITLVTNESLSADLGTGVYTIADNTNQNFVQWNATLVLNGTLDVGQATTNETLVEGTDYQINAANGTLFNLTDENWNLTFVTYNVQRQATGEVNSEAVIDNITGGFGTFFGFSNTFFTIAAIVLLIFMLVGLLAIVMEIAEGRKGKKNSGFAGQ